MFRCSAPCFTSIVRLFACSFVRLFECSIVRLFVCSTLHSALRASFRVLFTTKTQKTRKLVVRHYASHFKKITSFSLVLNSYFVCLFVRLFVCSFVCLFVCSFVRLFIRHYVTHSEFYLPPKHKKHERLVGRNLLRLRKISELSTRRYSRQEFSSISLVRLL
jgi:hypothetical protein